MYYLVPLLVWTALHWPTCFRWPFCPGVFIAILSVVAAVVTFWERPPWWAKGVATFLFLLLMSAEVWMMSKDRDHHDEIERGSRDQENAQSANISILMLQNADARADQAKALASLSDISRNIPIAKGKLQEIAALQSKADTAQKRADDSAKQFAISVLPNTTKQMVAITNDYETRQYFLNDRIGTTERIARDDPEEGRRRKEGLAKEQQQELTTYGDQMKPLLNTADYLRQTLLRGLQLTGEDKNWEALFKKALGGDFSSFKGKGAAHYLNTLAERATH